MKLLKFIAAAFTAGVAYIDCDGCVLETFHVPQDMKGTVFAFVWWKRNLKATPVVKHRLPLLYLLKFMGVKLVLWTNRSSVHYRVTKEALGKHADLFSQVQFRDGVKILDRLDGPVMDDNAVYLTCGKGPGLLVKSV